MRIAIFENIMTSGGHEVDFDRIIVDELLNLNHQVNFYVPSNFQFQFNYKVPVNFLNGDAVTYSNSHGIKKIFYSIKREFNRQRWFNQLFNLQNDFDSLIIPTSTYRYLRALNHNQLKNISKPLIFILHGINPTESKKFFHEASKLEQFTNIKLIVLTFNENIFGHTAKNIFTLYPPTFIPRDIDLNPVDNEELTIGFFGQYRREKNLDSFLNVFTNLNFNRKIKLIVQGSTMHSEDSEDFERIIKKYSAQKNISFIHKGLIGAEWQKAISKIDVLLMPYSAPRYRYHWSAMLFTAIGFHKPVIASDDINPEVFNKFRIGETFSSGDLNSLANVLESFVNNFDLNHQKYIDGLNRAAYEFSPDNFALRLEKFLKNS